MLLQGVRRPTPGDPRRPSLKRFACVAGTRGSADVHGQTRTVMLGPRASRPDSILALAEVECRLCNLDWFAWRLPFLLRTGGGTGNRHGLRIGRGGASLNRAHAFERHVFAAARN